MADNRALTKQVAQMSQQLVANKSSDLSAQVIDIAGISFLAAQVDGDNKTMMQTLDIVRSQLPTDAMVVLASVDNGKVSMVAATSKSLSANLSAARLMQTVAPLVGARGGGRPDLARAGGGDQVDAVAQALIAAQEWVEGQVAS